MGGVVWKVWISQRVAVDHVFVKKKISCPSYPASISASYLNGPHDSSALTKANLALTATRHQIDPALGMHQEVWVSKGTK